MKLLNLTLATLAENLALDEALLAQAEASGQPREVLRLWESPQIGVIVGRSSKVAEEVNLAGCQRCQIPVLRRPSGGAAVVIGPGCFMYTLLLGYDNRPALRQIDATHRFVLGTLAKALQKHVPDVAHRGTSDLTIGNNPASKFSGNSLRCKQTHLLYHGTLLYDFPLAMIETCLKMPPRQPEYRAGRRHRTFVSNLPLGRHTLREIIVEAFAADDTVRDWPRSLVNKLAAQRYSQDAWNREGRRTG